MTPARRPGVPAWELVGWSDVPGRTLEDVVAPLRNAVRHS